MVLIWSLSVAQLDQTVHHVLIPTYHKAEDPSLGNGAQNTDSLHLHIASMGTQRNMGCRLCQNSLLTDI